MRGATKAPALTRTRCPAAAACLPPCRRHVRFAFPSACALYRLAKPVWCPATLQGVAQTAVGAVRSTLVDCQRARVVLPELQVSTSAAPRLQSVAAILDTTAPRNIRVPMSQHSSASETVDHSRPPEPQKQVRAGLLRVSNLVSVHPVPSAAPAPPRPESPGPAWPRPTVLVGLCVLTGRRRVGCSRHWSSAQPRVTWLRLRSSAHGY